MTSDQIKAIQAVIQEHVEACGIREDNEWRGAVQTLMLSEIALQLAVANERPRTERARVRRMRRRYEVLCEMDGHRVMRAGWRLLQCSCGFAFIAESSRSLKAAAEKHCLVEKAVKVQ